jgi:hypothetical protein
VEAVVAYFKIVCYLRICLNWSEEGHENRQSGCRPLGRRKLETVLLTARQYVKIVPKMRFRYLRYQNTKQQCSNQSAYNT